ncbi:Serine endopeptidase inhibitor [Xenococcus sp. PCC 7305]|uniref:microviridin/marinostatin family tricyclic proteinase inhibitor n=1 Tax=Xenococcus sp. PCC 7305 TaxID=102125 RepID=UPI0002ACF44E|nr:microviridin/marinostatin family tricyclic proteinase inhibitor [Xenococcus sp. PCC 7305]ELS03781.1 Serine endopeptidase inhibitor [Xenococcus sp. PCC 7305]
MMSDNKNSSNDNRQESNLKAVPFFVRYLEGQLESLTEEETELIYGGMDCPGNNGIETRKYPSDSDEEIAMTLKYPSDNEEGVIGPPVTLKFPSDQEDPSGSP